MSRFAKGIQNYVFAFELKKASLLSDRSNADHCNNAQCIRNAIELKDICLYAAN